MGDAVNDKTEKISYSEFYNDLINSNIELKEDFINWKQEEGYDGDGGDDGAHDGAQFFFQVLIL